jgi:hypothetical protein
MKRRDSLIRNQKDLTAVWTPTAIMFSDGTHIVDLITMKNNN